MPVVDIPSQTHDPTGKKVYALSRHSIAMYANARRTLLVLTIVLSALFSCLGAITGVDSAEARGYKGSVTNYGPGSFYVGYYKSDGSQSKTALVHAGQNSSRYMLDTDFMFTKAGYCADLWTSSGSYRQLMAPSPSRGAYFDFGGGTYKVKKVYRCWY